MHEWPSDKRWAIAFKGIGLSVAILFSLVFLFGLYLASEHQKRSENPSGTRSSLVPDDALQRKVDEQGLVWRGVDIVRDLAFTPNGNMLAVAVSNGDIHFINLRKKDRPAISTTERFEDASCLAFSADSRRIALGSHSGLVQVWELPPGGQRTSLRNFSSDVWRVAFTVDAGSLVALGTAYFRDRDDGPEVRGLRAVHWDYVGSRIRHSVQINADAPWLAVARDGSRLATVSHGLSADARTPGKPDIEVKLWDRTTGRQLMQLGDYEDRVYGMTFSHDGATLATDGSHGSIRIWDLGNARERLGLPAMNYAFGDIAISPKGNLLVCRQGYGGGASLWDLATGNKLAQFDAHPTASISRMAISPDGSTLVTANSVIDARDSHVPVEVRMWDIAALLKTNGQAPK